MKKHRGLSVWSHVLACCGFLLLGLLAMPSQASAQSRPDLTVDITSVNDTTLAQGQSFQIRYRVRNAGSANASNVTVRFYYSTNTTIDTSDTYLGVSRTFSSLLARRTYPSTFTTYTATVVLPVDASTGTRYIGAIIDYNKQVTESNENNNTDRVTVAVRASTSTVDLQVSFVKLDKTTVKPGDTVTVEYRILNAGAANVTRSFQTRVYLSNNSTITTGDTAVSAARTDARINGKASLPSATTTYKTTITIPTNAAAGDYWISPLTDFSNRVRENVENNNYKATPIKVVALLADLQVDIVSVSDNTPTQGQTVDVRFRVSNTGSTAANNVKVRFYFSENSTISTQDTYLFVEQTYSLPGQTVLPSSSTTYTVKVTVPTNARTGARYIGAFIDYDSQIPESNNNNNTDGIAVTVGSSTNTRDLQITLLSLSTTRGKAGDSVTIRYRVFNAGRANITTAFKTRVYLSSDATITKADTSLGGDRNFTGINAGATLPGRFTNYSVTVRIPSTSKAGNYFIGILADWEEKVTENNETNNFRSSAYEIFNNQADLQMAITSLSATSVFQGRALTVRYRVSNTGGGNAGAFKIRIYLSKDTTITTSDLYLNAERSFTSLAAGGFAPSRTGSYTNSVTIPASGWENYAYIGIIVDYDTKVAEANETNNTANRQIFIRKINTVDLVVSFLKADKTTVAPGSQLTLEYRLKNDGNTDVTAQISTQVYRSSNNIVSNQDTALGGTQTVTGIKAGQTLPSATTTYKVVVTIPSNTPLGTYYIGPVVDYNNRITETNNNNNGRGVQIVVGNTKQPDLEATSIKVAPTSAQVGGSVQVEITITNKGNADVGRFIHHLYYSTDSTITTRDRYLGAIDVPQGLKVGVTYTFKRSVTIAAGYPTGAGFFGLLVDPSNAIKESSETNNTKATAFTVQVDNDKDGVPNNIDCDDNDKTVFPAYNGKPAAKEVCDGKDNDCNKTVDDNIPPVICYSGSTGCTQQGSGNYNCKGSCKAGIQTCQNGKLSACVGEVKPATETCNGKDDDCNGTIDDNNVCKEPTVEPTPEPAVEPAPEPVADAGSPTEPTPDTATNPDNTTKPDTATNPDNNTSPDTGTPDAGTNPDTSTNPDNNTSPDTSTNPDNNTTPDTGTPDAGTNPDSTTTPDTNTSEPGTPDAGGVDLGGPPEPNCYVNGCPPNEICQNGACIPDPCAGAQCNANQICKGGACVDICGCKQCPNNETCVDGQCVPDSCATAQCASDEVCDPDNGQCVKNQCPTIRCEAGRVCSLNKCVDDPCANIKCPAGNKCQNGQCVGENCGGENPGESSTGEASTETTDDAGTTENTTTESTNNESTNNEGPSTIDEDNTDTNTNTDEGTTTEQATPEAVGESGNSDKSGGSGNDGETSDLPPPVGGGCCEIGRVSTPAQSFFLMLLLGIFLLSLQRRRRRSE